MSTFTTRGLFGRMACGMIPAVSSAALIFGILLGLTSAAHADLDGHGPDSWRVHGVASNDVLNARMGPGTNYAVIETFAHDERGLQQITCVPFYTAAHFERMTQAQFDALPSRWCLMRDRSMMKAGWVAQRFITPDDTVAAPAGMIEQPASADEEIEQAQAMVQNLYEAQIRADRGTEPDPLFGGLAGNYFTSDIVDLLQSGWFEAHPLYDAQDFDVRITRIAPDPDQPMLRGMITIRADFTNFGHPRTAYFYLRRDTTQPGAALRIFRVQHEGWSYP